MRRLGNIVTINIYLNIYLFIESHHSGASCSRAGPVETTRAERGDGCTDEADNGQRDDLSWGADEGGQGDWLRASVDLLHGRGAVAVGVVASAVEGLAAGTGAQGVHAGKEGVAVLTRLH
jgi:hypothetical protein